MAICLESRAINLYVDQETRETFVKEAKRYQLSFSAYLRVLARAFRAWGKSQPNRPMDDLREEIRHIIEEESRRV